MMIIDLLEILYVLYNIKYIWWIVICKGKDLRKIASQLIS